MKKWKIDYGTGAGNFEMTAEIEDVMKKADNGAAYTQESYVIIADDGETWIRSWCGVEYDPDAEDDAENEIISFGKFGYYAAWRELD